MALRIFKVFVWVFLTVNLSLNQTLLTFFLCVRQTWMTQLILSISLWGLSSFNSNRFCYSFTRSSSLSEGRASFCTEFICRKLYRFRLDLLHSLSFFFFLCWSPSSSLCIIFDAILSNIDEVLSINPSANKFVFVDFNIHHKDWLTYSGGTGRPGELL